MANIKIPFIGPIQWYTEDLAESARFISKDFIDWQLPDTILPWEQAVCWNQPWQKSDSIHDQIQSPYGPVNFRLYTADGGLVDTVPYSQIVQNESDPALWVYEVDVDMSGYPEGFYFARLTFGAPASLILRSANIYVAEKIENTLLLEYQHYKFREDMLFETSIFPSIRIPAIKKYKSTESRDTVYEDQVLNIETLRSLNFRLWELRIGLASGIPDFMADKISRMLGCSRVLIDDKEYTKSEGAKMEPLSAERYPLRAWIIELREKFNRGSKYLSGDGDAQNARVAVMINVDSKGFGTDTGGDETVVQDVE